MVSRAHQSGGFLVVVFGQVERVPGRARAVPWWRWCGSIGKAPGWFMVGRAHPSGGFLVVVFGQVERVPGRARAVPWCGLNW